MQGPKRRGLPATSGGSCLQKHIEAFEAILRKDMAWKRGPFGISVKDGWDWMTPANNVGMWHRRVERSSLHRFLSWFSDVLSAALLLRLDFSIVDTFACSRMTSEYFYSPGFGSHVFRSDGVPTLLPQYGCRRKQFRFVGMHHYQSMLLAGLGCHPIDELSQQSTSCRDISSCVNSIASTPSNCCFRLPRRRSCSLP